MAAGPERRAKDAAMAAYLKAHKIIRKTMRCPICHAEISISQAYVHISFHK